MLVFGTYYDYANGQNLSVSTDKPIYNVGDAVVIFGTVQPLTATAANEPVKVELLEPSNIMHPIGQPIPQDGRYEHGFELVGELAKEGTWTVRAVYAGQEAFTTFKVVAAEITIFETGYSFTVNTDKRSYVGSDIIMVSGTVPVVVEGLVVIVSVFDPTNTVYITSEVPPYSDGTYDFDFVIEARLPIEGIYTVQAFYNDRPAKTAFSYAAGISAIISIDSLSLDQVRWGLDSVTVYGSVMDVSEGYMVRVNWGDRTSETGIPIADNSWGPVSHVYDSSSVGNNRVTAELMSNDPFGEILATSEPYAVNVLKHRTSLTLDPMDDVLTDSGFRVSGSLYDSDADVGISGATIIFEVSTLSEEIVTIETVRTGSDGDYLISGDLSRDLLDNELLFQVSFEGDDLYVASEIVGNMYIIEDFEVGTYTTEEDYSALLSLSAAVPVIAVATIITLRNVPKPRRKPSIPKDPSATISVQFEVEIKR